MVDKSEDKKKKVSFSDSAELFESIFKEATLEIQKETGKIVARPGLKPKPGPEAKPKPQAKPKAPTKLELEPKEEPVQEKPRSEPKPGIQPPIYKARQEPVRKPVASPSGPAQKERESGLLSTKPVVPSRIPVQKPKEEATQEAKKPKAPKKQAKRSPVLRIILLLILLGVGVGAASLHFGIIDVSDFLGGPEPAPKIAATKPSPVQPPAKPAEAPKQPIQPPQPPPKPAETVAPPQPAPPAAPPAVAPPQPPGVQAGAKPPEPPAVTKVETPPAVAQAPTPVKAEAPPASVQPPVKSQPSSPAPPVPAAAASEPKPLPAPVQQPAASKKAETQPTGSRPMETSVAKPVPLVSGTGASYSFSVYLGSFHKLEQLKKALSIYENEGLSPYWAKVELAEKGAWYRVFTGYFKSAQEAAAHIQQKRIKDGEVKETRYSNLIGIFGTKQAGEEKALALRSMGLSAYWIPAANGQVRLYSGAFTKKEDAEKNRTELSSKGIESEIVER